MKLRLLTAAFCLSLAFGITAQPTLSVDRTEALIGDHIDLKLTIPGAAPGDWVNADVQPADTVATIQVVSEQEMVAGANSTTLEKVWTIAVFDTGVVRIPPVPVVINRTGGPDSFLTNDIPLQISGVTDSLGMAPIKPIVYEPVRFSDYLPYILGLIGMILLGLFLWWWSKRPKKAVEKQVVVPEDPPHEIALRALVELERRELWQKGEVKEYHSELSHILRQYLEARYDVSALESTTSELRAMLQPFLDEEQFEQMIKMMQLEDLVKFAKATPPESVHEEHLVFVRQFIKQTIPKEKPVENA